MQEIWKPIKDFEDRYEVSNFGNVKSLKYGNRNEARLLVPKCNNAGRLWVELWENGRKKCMLIHRLVAQAFIPNPNNDPQINHIDENPKNNRVDNLEWCTAEYNVHAYIRNHPIQTRVFQPSPKYRKHDKPIAQIDKNGKVVRVWDSPKTACSELNYNEWSILQCLQRVRKTAYGYIWRYANENISDKEAAI